MPARKGVPPLRVRALAVACSFIVAQVQLRRQHRPICRIPKVFAALLAVPTDLLSDLLSEALLHRPDMEAEERLTVLRLLLRSDLRVLSTGPFPATLHVAVLDLIKKRGGGLRHLDLRGVWTRDGGAVSAAALVAMVASVPRLDSLSVPHSCSDALLVAIASHCHHLQFLDVSGEGFIGPVGIEALASSACASTLQKVDIGCRAEARVDPSVAARLLTCCPRLRSLGSYAYTGSAVAALPVGSTPTQLTYLRDKGTTLKRADAVMRLCPRLQFVYVDSPQDGVLPVLAELAALRIFKVRSFRMSELLCFLQKAGPRIKSLELVGQSDDSLPLEAVAACCPNLERLDCGQIAVVPHVSVLTRFPSLRSFRVAKTLLSSSTVRIIARAAPKLESLAILTPVLDMEDGDVASLFAGAEAGVGAKLSEVWFSAAPRLTQDAVLTLMSSAPQLRIIGDLAGWDIDVEQILQLRLLMAECNLDLALWTSDDALDEAGNYGIDVIQDILGNDYVDDWGEF